MTEGFIYLTKDMQDKLEKLVDVWKNNEMAPIRYGTMNAVFPSKTIYGVDNIFEKQELIYLNNMGFINIINDTIDKNMEEQWAMRVEPTYSGINYSKVAFVNTIADLKWIVTTLIAILGLIVR